MINLIANLLAWSLILGLFGVGIFLNYSAFVNPKILDITIIAMLISVATILTNAVSYHLPFLPNNNRIDLGAFLIFLIGCCFGPYWGVLSGIISDSLGLLLGINGAYSALFTLNKVLYGFFGAMVFLWNFKKYWWIIFMFNYLVCFLIVSFGVDVAWIYVTFGANFIIPSLTIKVIKAAVEIPVYIILSLTCFETLWQLIKHKIYHEIWVKRFNFDYMVFILPWKKQNKACYNK